VWFRRTLPLRRALTSWSAALAGRRGKACQMLPATSSNAISALIS